MLIFVLVFHESTVHRTDISQVTSHAMNAARFLKLLLMEDSIRVHHVSSFYQARLIT